MHRAVVHDIAAIVYVGVRTVGAAEPVLARPDLPVPRHDGAQFGGDPCTILGMDAVGSPGRLRTQVAGCVTEQGRDALVPPEAVRAEVPVPNRVVGGAGHDLEPLVAAA
jgi:hypothetical protein